MIKKLLRSLARLAPGHAHGHGKAGAHDPQVYKASRVGIDRALVSSAANRTVEGLQKAGYRAFIVGGAVRDLMLGMRPKDFDVATDATPEQVQRIFRRARIIGRRFKIVHVMFGAETIEVSTFRALSADNQEIDAHGRVLNDNTFGEQHEDATRRDFTINALYYDPLSDSVLDYHHGVEDLKARLIRMIGDPAQRYREDPVRMLRVVRFAAFGLTPPPRLPSPNWPSSSPTCPTHACLMRWSSCCRAARP
ncbi:MAG: polynucleotide adenylyltransferase PcnB [Pseudomonadota bacterium]